jgi:Ca2+-dependent lipid-binding protein
MEHASTAQMVAINNLPAVDKSATCNPYINIKLGQQVYQSEARANTSNPKWADETFTFVVNPASVGENKEARVSTIL